MDKQLYFFEIETTYKCGRKRNEVIASANEESMWKYYDKHHNEEKIQNSVIVDSWAV